MASALVLRREINGSSNPAGGLLAYLRARQKILYQKTFCFSNSIETNTWIRMFFSVLHYTEL